MPRDQAAASSEALVYAAPRRTQGPSSSPSLSTAVQPRRTQGPSSSPSSSTAVHAAPRRTQGPSNSEAPAHERWFSGRPAVFGSMLSTPELQELLGLLWLLEQGRWRQAGEAGPQAQAPEECPRSSGEEAQTLPRWSREASTDSGSTRSTACSTRSHAGRCASAPSSAGRAQLSSPASPFASSASCLLQGRTFHSIRSSVEEYQLVLREV